MSTLECGGCGSDEQFTGPIVPEWRGTYYRFTNTDTNEIVHECPEVIREARQLLKTIGRNMKQRLTTEQKLSTIKQCFFNGHKRLVVPYEWGEDQEFRTAFNQWIRNISTCKANLRDPYDLAQWICSDSEGHQGRHFGGIELPGDHIVREPATPEEIAHSLERALQQESSLHMRIEGA